MRDLLLAETYLLSGGDSDHQCDDHHDHDDHEQEDNHAYDFDFSNWFA